ncbi:MAG TPA: hypothetical protein VNQ14_09000 [Woeseiaceae bacterium]|nr:hypothetical protein [Woeseiaceae bacterium]
MNSPKPAGAGWEANIKKQTVKLALWTFGWLLSMALATFGPKFLWHDEVMSMAAIGLNLLIGLGMIRASRDHLRSLDEMQQKIQLDAMGLTLGVGLVAGLAYSNLDISNVVAFDAEISHLVVLMGLTYLAAVIFGHRKYQ